MTRKRIVIESILFAVVIYAGYMAFMVVQGMILTQRYVSSLEMTRQYEQTQMLQSQVKFGLMGQNSIWTVVITIGGLIVAGSVYGCIRWFGTKRK